MVDLITHDVEKIYQVLKRCELPQPFIDLFIEQHETIRQLQRALNEYAEQQGKMISALSLVNKGFGQYAERLQRIEKRYSDPHKDMVEHAEHKDD